MHFYRKLFSFILIFLLVFSQVAFSTQVINTGSVNTENTAKSYMPPNPNAYPELYSKGTTKTDGRMMQTPNISYGPGKETVAPKSMSPAAGSTEQVLVIPVDFTDVPFTNPTQRLADFGILMNGLKDYYEKNSGYVAGSKGMSINATVSPIVHSTHTMTYYGTDTSGQIDTSPGVTIDDLAREAVQLLESSPSGFNFQSFDTNSDGVIDHLFIIHAGSGQEAYSLHPEYIWSHRYSIGGDGSNTPGYTNGELVDGKYAYNYAMVPEDGTLGVFCHEFGHDIGLPDLYDTDGNANGVSFGIGDWDLMSSGSWNGNGASHDGTCPSNLSAWCKEYMGWVNPTIIDANNTYTLTNTDGIHYGANKVWTYGDNSGNEYFLVEYRNLSGYDASLPGRGILVWHIDKQRIDSTISTNSINNDETRLGVELEQADGNWDMWNIVNYGDAGDPFPGSSNNKNFTGTPYEFNYSNITGVFSYVELIGINIAGDFSYAEAYYDITAKKPASAPSLNTPAVNDAIPSGGCPTFTWGIAPQTEVYILEISEKSDFSTVLYSINLGTTKQGLAYNGNVLSFTLPLEKALTAGKSYYWHVAGINSSNFSGQNVDWNTVLWSETRKIGATAPVILSVSGTSIQGAGDQILIQFDETVVPTDSPADKIWHADEFEYIKSGARTLKLDNATFSFAGTTLTITLDEGTDKDYLINGESIIVKPAVDKIQNSVPRCAANQDSTPSAPVFGDVVQPTVVSLTKDHADTIVRDADAVVITATFSEAMQTAPTISIDAQGTDVDITSQTMDGSGTTWTYSWNVPAAHDGSAVVTVSGVDLAGNHYTGTDSITFTIDNTAPVVQNIEDARTYILPVTPIFNDGTATLKKGTGAPAEYLSGTTIINNGTYQLVVTDTAGNTTTLNFIIDKLYDVFVTCNSGTVPTTMPVAEVYVSNGMAQIQLVKDGVYDLTRYELLSLGVTADTEFKIKVYFNTFTPRMLLGLGKDVNQFLIENSDDANFTTMVTILVKAAATDSKTGAVIGSWPLGDADKADVSYNEAVMLAIDNLEHEGTVDQKDLLNGAVLVTDAQAFGSPVYTAATGDQPAKIELMIAGPHFDKNGNENTGFFEAHLPSALLTAWGVTNTNDLSATFLDTSAPVVTAEGNGMKLVLNIHYSSDKVSIFNDTILPTIVGSNLAVGNTYIDINFSEGVYGNSDGTGGITVDDLAMTFDNKGGSVTAIIASLTKADGTGDSLNGGETIVRVNLTVNGTPSGAETIQINPVAASVYDKAGNTMLNTETSGLKNLKDLAVPTITGSTVDSNNGYIDINFSEGVFGNANGTGRIEASDLALTFTQNGGNATGATIASITKTDGTTLAGGETTVRVNLAITGIPSGQETIEIKPNGTAIYDSVGNAMASSETTTAKALYHRLKPTITAGALAADNSYVDLTFSEGVYSLGNGTGILTAANFNATLSPGGTVTGITVASVSKTDNSGLAGGETAVRVHLTYTGTPSGVETIEVKPATIYDIAGNAMLTTQTSGVKTLKDQLKPTIVSSAIATGNSYIDVTFSEGVYGAADGVSKLLKDNFVLTFTQNSGTVTNVALASITKTNGSALTGGETTVRFNLTLTETSDIGVETIVITPANGTSVYDAIGNAMLDSQTTGSVSLKEQIAPVVTITTATVDSGANITTLKSSEIGTAYLVPQASYATKAALDAAVNGSTGTKATITQADTNTTITAPTSAGTYKAYAVDATGNISLASAGTITVNVPVIITPPIMPPVINNPPVTTNPPVVAPKPQVDGTGVSTFEVVPNLEPGTTTASAEVSNDTLNQAMELAVADKNGVKTVVIEVNQVAGATEYVQKLPASALTGTDAGKVIEVSTPVGTIQASGNMFNDAQTKAAQNVSLSIGIADTSKLQLDQATKDAIGSRPVIELSAVVDNKTVAWSNPDAPVEVSFKYTPTQEELRNPQYITVWYIDGSGKAVSIPNARYDLSTGLITFKTTHFSKYAVAYVHKTFSDLQKYSWAKQNIEILASKGILDGKGENTYKPGVNVTRADFLMYLVRALGLSAKFDTNFDDVKKTDNYYEAIGIAKKLGITDGTGNNKFGPNTAITREDMMVLVVRALKAAGKLQDKGKLTDLSMFTDKSKVSSYAVEGVSTLVRMGIIEGSNGRINPKGNTTRAEIACVIYRIINK